MLKVGLRFLNTGYCKALERITLRQGGWRLIRCPALVALIEHPTQGAILFDTGYASHVLNESRRFPLRLYRSITPMHFTPEQSAAAQLHRLGVGEVSTIVLSHFHADHVGGLKDFPGARFVYLKEAYDAVHGRSGWNALRKAFIPGLIPEDFLERSDVITDATPRVALPYESFPWGYDLLGDHSLVGVPLPGHADGQMGLWIPNSDQGPVFLVADACWHSQAYRDGQSLHPLGRLVVDDVDAYHETLHKLHALHREAPELRLLPTHCPELWRQA